MSSCDLDCLTPYRRKYVDDAYVLAFPLGFLGLHHFYLNRPGWGFLYFFSLGCFGVGWILDLFRMPCLVKEANQRLEEERMLAVTVQGALGGTPATRVVVSQRSYVIQPHQPQPPGQHSHQTSSTSSREGGGCPDWLCQLIGLFLCNIQ